MTNKQLAPKVRAWLKDSERTPQDVRRSVAMVSSQAERTRQRGRWWPLPSLRRKTHDVDQPTRQQAGAAPAVADPTPTVSGRTRTMLSPVKAITAGAIVFAIGGAFLIAQPFEQSGSVPGAEAEDAAPTWVTGTIRLASGNCSGPDTEADGDVIHQWNYVCDPQRWTASDARLSGEVASVWNDDEYRLDDGLLRVVNMSALFLRNDGGEWTCSSPNLLGGGGLHPAGLTGGGATYTCVGNDGYAELSAILVLDGAKGYSREFTGLIFSGDFPPLPEPPAEE